MTEHEYDYEPKTVVLPSVEESDASIRDFIETTHYADANGDIVEPTEPPPDPDPDPDEEELVTDAYPGRSW